LYEQKRGKEGKERQWLNTEPFRISISRETKIDEEKEEGGKGLEGFLFLIHSVETL